MKDKEDKNLCIIYLVRHGQTESNKAEYIMGHLDALLTEDGEMQVKQTANELKDVHFDAVFSSDLGRAHRTAEIIKLERDLAVQTTQALRERNFGRWENKTIEEFRKNFKEIYEKMREADHNERVKFKPSPDMESDEEIISRFITFLREVAVAYRGKTVLVATHGGCIRTFHIHLGYFTYKIIPSGAVENAGYVKVSSDGVDFFVDEVRGVKDKLSD